MTDLGLVSVLSVAYYVALALVTCSFCVAVSRPERRWPLLSAHVVVLLVMLHGTPAILYGTLRYAWAWKHVGIVDYILRHGSVDQSIGQLTVYQDWPAFFSFVALILRAGGLGSALAIASWAPLFNNLLFAAATMFVVRSLTSDRRLAWLAVWIFCSTNWVGQDYFSPQANAYFLYLVLIGVCLRWLVPAGAPAVSAVRRFVPSERLARGLRELIRRGLAEQSPTGSDATRAVLAVLVIVIAAAIVTSHQLTPFMLILSLGALVAFQLCLGRGLPVLVAVMAGGWALYMSVAFLEGNVHWILASIGSLNIGSSTLSNLGVASQGHVIVAQTARALTGAVWVLAVVGLLRRLRHGHVDLAAALLATAPVLMVWGNAYGGEILFRIYFFALPFLAFLAAGLVFPSLRPAARSPIRLTLAICVPLLAGMVVSYYGNERMYRFSHGEVRAARYLVGKAPRGSTIVAVTPDYPLAFRHYEFYNYAQMTLLATRDRRKLIDDPVDELTTLAAPSAGGQGYVVFSRSQAAEVEMTGELPAGSLQRIEDAVSGSPRFSEVFRNADAQVFELVDPTALP